MRHCKHALHDQWQWKVVNRQNKSVHKHTQAMVHISFNPSLKLNLSRRLPSTGIIRQKSIKICRQHSASHRHCTGSHVFTVAVLWGSTKVIFNNLFSKLLSLVVQFQVHTIVDFIWNQSVKAIKNTWWYWPANIYLLFSGNQHSTNCICNILCPHLFSVPGI